ncbi:nucleotidyltransferase domain-containing protein [Metallumcola ferriviriculae]|uniref:Nucleotidyltransferase domain-containing protein n=1 Tax=Metallumcola ferriviriculae TaxID=3039180 RepID=A0AAU0UJT2_9FIRM|nr:nucleotidyltransferase domain-containing protein [Desulfitibacteraceae bacterium MK1]
MQRKEVLNRVKNTLLEYTKNIPLHVYLFGSWAKNKERHTSDIDIGILSKDTLSSEYLVNLRSHLEESTIPYRVDVVDLSEVDPVFLKRVKEEGILWKD